MAIAWRPTSSGSTFSRTTYSRGFKVYGFVLLFNFGGISIGVHGCRYVLRVKGLEVSVFGIYGLCNVTNHGEHCPLPAPVGF